MPVENRFVARNFFGFAQVCGDPLAHGVPVGDNARRNERPEEVALAAFVYARVELVPFGVEGFVVAELRKARDFGFEDELDEVFRALALNHDLPRRIRHNVHVGALVRELRVVDRKRRPEVLVKPRIELFRLFVGNRDGVEGFLFGGVVGCLFAVWLHFEKNFCRNICRISRGLQDINI